MRERATKTGKATKTTADQAAHVKAECALREHPALGRWLRQQPSGRLVIDRAKVTAEQRLDGKYLLSTSDPDLPAEDAPRPRAALLARPAAGPGRRTPHGTDPAPHRHRAQPGACRHPGRVGRQRRAPTPLTTVQAGIVAACQVPRAAVVTARDPA